MFRILALPAIPRDPQASEAFDKAFADANRGRAVGAPTVWPMGIESLWIRPWRLTDLDSRSCRRCALQEVRSEKAVAAKLARMLAAFVGLVAVSALLLVGLMMRLLADLAVIQRAEPEPHESPHVYAPGGKSDLFAQLC